MRNEPSVLRLALALAIADALFVGAYLAYVAMDGSSLAMRRLLDLDAEYTLAAWFTSGQLLLIGVLLLATAVAERHGRRIVPPWFLALVGLAFVFLSADEATGIHETATLVLWRYSALPRFSGNHGMWIPIYLAIGACGLGLTVRHWLRLWRGSRRAAVWLYAGAAVFLTGAVGLEILSYGLRDPVMRRLYTLEVAMEEGMELAGASMMLVGAFLLARSTLARAGPSASPPDDGAAVYAASPPGQDSSVATRS